MAPDWIDVIRAWDCLELVTDLADPLDLLEVDVDSIPWLHERGLVGHGLCVRVPLLLVFGGGGVAVPGLAQITARLIWEMVHHLLLILQLLFPVPSPSV